MNKIFYTSCDTVTGKIFIASSADGLCKISLTDGGEGEEDFFAWIKKNYLGWEIKENKEKNTCVIKQLEDYFSGKLKIFDLKLDLKGTPFQMKVWESLKKIPYGQTRTYKEIAEITGKKRAFRAVGGANRANPLPVIIPCHRVIGSDGSLTGYAGKKGLHIKEFLLKLEKP